MPSGEDAPSAQLQPVQDLATTPPIPQSEDENSDDYPPADDVGSLWTTLSTFVALFVLTLLYSGIVTFIKVRGTARSSVPLGVGMGPFQGTCRSSSRDPGPGRG
ncbi:delta chain C region membrane-bound form [Plecturocebus cupreus]